MHALFYTHYCQDALSAMYLTAERKKKMIEENHHEVEVLKEQADKLEQKWQSRKVCEVNEWKDKISKKQECWEGSVKRCKETRKKEHEKHIEELLGSCHPPSCADPKASNRRHKNSSSVSLTSSSKAAHQPTVRFNPTPTVHILEQALSEEEYCEDGFVEEMETAADTDCVEVIELEPNSFEDEEEEEEEEGFGDSDEMEIAMLESDCDVAELEEGVTESTDSEVKDEPDFSANIEQNSGTSEEIDSTSNNVDGSRVKSSEVLLSASMHSDLDQEATTSDDDGDAETRSIASSIVSSAIGKAIGKVASTQSAALE